MSQYFRHLARRSGLDHDGGRRLNRPHRRRRGAGDLVEIATRTTGAPPATASSVAQEEASGPIGGGDIEANETDNVGGTSALPAPSAERRERSRPQRTIPAGSASAEVDVPPIAPAPEPPEHTFPGPIREPEQSPVGGVGDEVADNTLSPRQSVLGERNDPRPAPQAHEELRPAPDRVTERHPLEVKAESTPIAPLRPDTEEPAPMNDGPATQAFDAARVAEAPSPVGGPVTAARVQGAPGPAQESRRPGSSALPEAFPAVRPERRRSGAEVRIGAITLEVHQTAREVTTPAPAELAPRATGEHAPPPFRTSRHYLRGM